MHEVPVFSLNKISLIIPAYNPSEYILEAAGEAARRGFSDIIVVNDGSREDRAYLFEVLAKKQENCLVTILRHDLNKGKGAALKTGFAFFMENRPDFSGVVTMDSDGQHLAEDALRCAEKMAESGTLVLGQRNFTKTGIPFKSLLGNRFTAFLYRLETGLFIKDTQTGLRAIPKTYIPACLRIPGNRYEYEMNMLLAAKRERFIITQVPVNTVYIKGNMDTHFRAFTDSIIILFQFIKYSAGALISFCLDLLVFYAVIRWLLNVTSLSTYKAVLVSAVTARIVSAALNFTFNTSVVFGYKDNKMKAVLRYAALCLVVLTVSSQAVALLGRLPFNYTPFTFTWVKGLVDTGLFIINYFIQKKWVYRI